jgi:hypothetical protein
MTDYQLTWTKAGEDHYVSRNNNYTVSKIAPRQWVVRNGRGHVIAQEPSAPKAKAWASRDQARKLGYDMTNFVADTAAGPHGFAVVRCTADYPTRGCRWTVFGHYPRADMARGVAEAMTYAFALGLSCGSAK